MTAYLDAMRRYADFSGRSSRSQFWLFTLVYLVILLVAAILDSALRIDERGEVLVITAAVYLVHLIPSLAVLARRLHDIDRSGWWMLIGFVPPVAIIVLLVFACTPSAGPNRFGRPTGNRSDASYQSHGGAYQADASHLDQLEKLASLRKAGTIDDAEFERMKADLIARSRA